MEIEHEFFLSMLRDRKPIRMLRSWHVDDESREAFSIIEESKWQGFTQGQKERWLYECRIEHERRILSD